jgi:hypothetical protein
MRFRFLLLLLLLSLSRLAGATVVLQARDMLISPGNAIMVLEDRGQQMSFDEVRQSTRFQAAPPDAANGLNFGYSASAWWLRLDLQRAPDAPEDWLLEVAFPLLDRIEFFGSQGEHVLTGDTLPFATRPVVDRHFVFPLKVGAGETASFYLRITSDGTMSVPLRLWQPKALYEENQIEYGLLATYYGIVVTLALYNLMFFFSLRDVTYLYYVLFGLSMGLGHFAFNGLAFQLLWPGWPVIGNFANVFGWSMAGVFGMQFLRHLFRTQESLPKIDSAMIAFAAVFAACVLVLPVFPYRYVSVQLSLAGLGAMVVAFVVGLAALRLKLLGARWFMMAGAALLVGIAATVMRNINWLPTNFFTIYGFQIGASIEMILLSFALAERLNLELQKKLDFQAEVLASKQELVDTLRRHEAELELRVKERTDALERANARLRANTISPDGVGSRPREG